MDAISRLWWGIRHHVVLTVAVIVGTGVLVAGVAPLAVTAPRYRAQALVVARSLTLEAVHLSRLAQTVFVKGGVVERAIRDASLPYDRRQLLRDHAELEPVEDNVAIAVIGQADDPALAARIANAVADALVQRLNAIGPGVGVFSVHTVARVPQEPQAQPGLLTFALVALVGGLILAVGAVGLLLVLRPPVLSPQEAEQLARAPTLGVLRLPPPAHHPAPTSVPGLSALMRTLYPGGFETCVFLGADGDGVHPQVATLAAQVLARSGKVRYVPAEDGVLAEDLNHPNIVVVPQIDSARPDRGSGPTVIEGPSSKYRDLPQMLPADARVVLVVLEGEHQAAVRAAADQFLPGELAGLLYVRTAPAGRRRSASRRGRTAARQPAPAEQPPAATADATADASARDAAVMARADRDKLDPGPSRLHR